MKSKNIPVDIRTKSIKEAQNEIKQIIEKLENTETNLEDSIEQYNRMMQLNYHIQEQFKKKLKEIRESNFDNNKISQIKEMMKEKFGNEFELKKIKNYSISDMTYNVEKIKRSIEAIGPINWAVSNEYEEQSKRLNILKDQRSDLLESEKNLKDAIKKIDSVAKKQFLDTFEKIKNNFETMFGVFFSGGKGSIDLEDTDDPLNSNVMIFAQPPGKKNNSLRMLSAGEKSLTAIALLFSIYQYKPSPFCILDEIDAPLDDINIKKFTDVISEYSKSTQFIMVTHNKLTMESADCIYGVTTEKKGISKVISINFTEK